MEIVELSLRQIGINMLSEPSTEDLLVCGKDLRRAFSLVGFVYIRGNIMQHFHEFNINAQRAGVKKNKFTLKIMESTRIWSERPWRPQKNISICQLRLRKHFRGILKFSKDMLGEITFYVKVRGVDYQLFHSHFSPGREIFDQKEDGTKVIYYLFALCLYFFHYF